MCWNYFVRIWNEICFHHGKEKLQCLKVASLSELPRLMLAKCATMQALRAGWPAEFSGLYVEEEMDRAKVLDASASELAIGAGGGGSLRQSPGSDLITVSFGGWSLENVPSRAVCRKCARLDRGARPRPRDEVRTWAEANREALWIFWAKSPVRCPGAEEGDRGALGVRRSSQSTVSTRPISHKAEA